jgi:uncharacterized repeat protein (TIGR01451 family)
MKATIWTLAALTGAVCMLAGVDAQPPGVRDDAPASELPGDEPKVVKPARPLSLPPRGLRKKEAVEPKAKKPEEFSTGAPSRTKSLAGPLDDDFAAPSRPTARPADPTDDLAASPDFRPTGNAKTSAVVKGDDEDDEPLPGTASVRRARRTVRSTENVGAPQSTGDASKAAQALTLEWACPTNIKAKHPFACEMIVRNNGTEAAQNVFVHYPAPEGFKIVSADPKPTQEDEMMQWSLGALEPKQERRIKVEMVADRRGELVCKATVTATTPSTARLKVTEPQLVVKQECPEKVLLGDSIPLMITVSNPGDGPTDSVVVRSNLSDGLKAEKGQEVVTEVGVLAAGESRVLKVVCQTVKGGSQQIATTATTSSGLTSAAEAKTSINEPKMEISMRGPKLRYLDRAATYTVVVSNPGDAPANEVRVSAAVPAGFNVETPSDNGRFDSMTRTISWVVGTVEPGEKKEVSYRCSATQIGEHKHTVTAQGARGLRGANDLMTKVEGIASLLMELADVDDPIEVGAETAYEVRITNNGSAPAMNVEIRALVPKAMTITSCQGPMEYKVKAQEVVFTAIPKLAPKADAVYRIKVKANAVGDVRFRARLASDSLSEPVIGEEGTKVYSDAK